FFDRDHDHISDRRVAALGAAEHLDAHHFAGARIIGDVEDCLHLYHLVAPYPAAFLSTRLTRQRLFLESGRDSIICTRSPSLHSPRSSCAMKRVLRRTRLPYKACSTMRSTLTTTVLAILADTTVPSRRLIRSRIGHLLARRGRAARLLAEQSHDERQLAACAPIAGVIIQLIGAQLEPQPENFLARLALLDAQIGRGHLP